jgi:O-acetylserine/cysteine efflux transporter
MLFRDIALAILIVGSWGLNVTLIRMAGLEVPPLLFLGVRFALVALIFAPFIARISKADLKNVFLYMLFYLVLHLGTMFVGLRYIESGTGALIFQAQVPFAVLIGWLFLREKFGVKTLAGIIMGISGVMLILLQNEIGEATWIGGILMLLSALFWATGSVRMRGIEDMNFATMSFYSHVMAAPFILALSFTIEDNHVQAVLDSNWLKVGGVMTYQVVLMTLCLYWWKGLMNRNKVYQVASFALLQPLFTVVFGIILLGENLSAMTIAGGALAFSGVAIIIARRAKKADPGMPA